MTHIPVEVGKDAPVPVTTPAPDATHSFRKEMDRLFERFFGGQRLPLARRMFEPEPDWRYEGSFLFSPPAVDLTEDSKAYKIAAELPGLDEKDIDVTVSGDVLTFRGKKHYAKDEADKNRHVSERAYGSFRRSFTLPDGIDRDNVTADLAKGVLTITLPKTENAQKTQKKIEINAAA